MMADDDLAVSLFTEDASYRSSPFLAHSWDTKQFGGYWREATGSQHEVEVQMRHPIVGGDRVAVEWRTTMIDERGEVTVPRLSSSPFCSKWALLRSA
jgi:hypothetical protein